MRDPFHRRPTGVFELRVMRGDRCIEHFRGPNLVVNGAKTLLSHLIGGDTTNRIVTTIGFGTGAAAPAVTDTALTGAFTKAMDSVSWPNSTTVNFNFSLLTTEGNGMAISEFGLLTGAGTLFARKTRSTPLNKAEDIWLNGGWSITF